ncbi:MAG: aminopeptidase P family N-terminal domain-containing protein [Gammaproteobacteria bacterium]|nr:aminopeptidase P family N-terminal domain-containing protein [Gammaproteobacteria bacterium]
MLALDENTYADRLDRIRADMAALDLAGLLLFDPENMFWLTGYQSIGYFTFQAMLVRPGGKPVLISRIVNRDLALAHPTIGAFEAIVDTAEPIEVLADFLSATPVQGAAVGIETRSRYLSAHDFARLVARSDTTLHPRRRHHRSTPGGEDRGGNRAHEDGGTSRRERPQGGHRGRRPGPHRERRRGGHVPG